MLHNYLAAALRNLARNRLYSAISLFALATGLCAVLLAGVVIHNELSYDRFIPGYERTHLVVSTLAVKGKPTLYLDRTDPELAALLSSRLTGLEAVTRLVNREARLRRGQIEGREKIYWADPNAFEVLPLPAVGGRLGSALRRPDGIVLTRAAARKYFGRDDPIGETLELNSHSMTVTAVVDDLPVNGTQLESGIFASGRASISVLTAVDAHRASGDGGPDDVLTYVRVAPDASLERLRAALPSVMHSVPSAARRPPEVVSSIRLVRLDEAHPFFGAKSSTQLDVRLLSGSDSGVRGRLYMIAAIGALTLLIACVVFVNLTTARSARRAVEIGIRKACGATRGALVLQFLGESLIAVLLAAVIAVALAELLLPYINAFLDAGARLSYWRNPDIIAWAATGAVLIGILGGIYPAFVLSAFHPAAALKSAAVRVGGVAIRRLLVTLQFAILIGLTIAAGAIYRQRLFATSTALRVDTDSMLIVDSSCDPALKSELLRLPEVRGAACASESFLTGLLIAFVRSRDGGELAFDSRFVDSDTFDLYGLRPVAGRFFSRTGGRGQFVVNETAVRKLGFRSSAAAIGQPLTRMSETGEIVGVVPDFSLTSVKNEIGPTIYVVDPAQLSAIHVKLTGRAIPETLNAIGRLGSVTGATEPPGRFFLHDHIQGLYLTMLRQAQAFGIFSGVAALLACLGLTGLAAATAQRRTREIGLRKALGADTGRIMHLLLGQFMRPVLLASLLAWPVTALALGRWLKGFAYRIDLEPWLFLAASASALIIALMAVSLHCWLVARESPVRALRYE